MSRHERQGAISGRAFWSGTITFGLVSIPVDLFSGERPRATSMKMVDSEGHALSRRYYCSKEGKPLDNDDLVRGFETKSGKLVVVTDEELEALAPEKSRDIDLRQFVALEQISPAFFNRPYFLLPSGQSTKAYHLLVETMTQSRRAGIATFVMREKEYLVAIVADKGVLRAETLRFADELRSASDVGLPPARKPAAAAVKKFAQAIGALERKELDYQELSDWYADEIRALVDKKRRKGKDVVEMPSDVEAEEGEQSAQVIDLMQVIKQRLARNASVSSAADSAGARREPKSHSKAATKSSSKTAKQKKAA